MQQPVMEACYQCSHSHCREPACHSSIQTEYDNLSNCLLLADKVLPRIKPGAAKSWWTSELTRLQQQSIEIHNLWKTHGKPRSGPVAQERLTIRAAYRRAIKAAQRAPKQDQWDKLHDAMTQADTNSFWKSWKKLYNKKGENTSSPIVNGVSSHRHIAETFKTSFEKNSAPNNVEAVNRLNDKFKQEYNDFNCQHNLNCDCKTNPIKLDTMLDAIFSMKVGKCQDDMGLHAEHFLNAPIEFYKRLVILTNSMLQHSYIPEQFRYGFIIPLVKDHQGDKTKTDNYRGITISPIFSKIFEHCLRLCFGDYLTTSQWQFGYKRKSSTVHAIYCLKETINYYTNKGNDVYCAFLDASKAFDRLVHSGLFVKLMNRGVPKVFLDIIITWYGQMFCRVRWGDEYSDWFEVTAGVRQGGVLSPDFYCLYVDDLIIILKSLKIGTTQSCRPFRRSPSHPWEP
jgi:hypothetical protein